jgi:hypothetical protein
VTCKAPVGSGGLTIELCAGSAGLSLALQDVGFRAVGVDSIRNEHKAKAPVIAADLVTPEGQQVVWKALNDPALAYVHLAPPCGTASAARGKPPPRGWVPGPFPPPRPLRSKEFPLGLAGLRLDEQVRVDKANKIYSFAAEVVRYCQSKGVAWSMENPTGSLFWEVPCIKDLHSLAGDYAVVSLLFDACMHGSRRDKRSKFLTNVEGLLQLALKCDGSHEHLPWGFEMTSHGRRWATAGEAEYPPYTLLSRGCPGCSPCPEARCSAAPPSHW